MSSYSNIVFLGIILKGGFPSYFCFLCDWDSRYQGNQYKRTNWRARDAENEKKLKLKNEPLIKQSTDILLPPLHIKLGIASKFIKTAVESSTEVFDCLKTIFPKLSDAKLKAGKLSILYQCLFYFSATNIFIFNRCSDWTRYQKVNEKQRIFNCTQ